MSYLDTARASLEALRGRADQSTPAKAGAEGGVTPDQVAAMRLDEFAQAGLVVRVWSEVLGCRVLFVSDNVRDTDLAGEAEPIYRAEELRKLAVLRPSPEQLRRVHEWKAAFQGTIENVEELSEPEGRTDEEGSP